MEALIPVGMGCFVIAFIVLIVFFGYHQTQKKATIWTQVAADLGLHHARPSNWNVGQIGGAFRDFQVEVRTFTRGSGKNKSTWTSIRTWANPNLGLGFKIYREGFLSGLGKMVGFQDIQTGDAEFDGRFTIKGADEGAVLQLLSPAVRGALTRYDSLASGGSFSDDGAYWETRGVMSKPERMKAMLVAQSEVVRAVCQAYLNSRALG